MLCLAPACHSKVPGELACLIFFASWSPGPRPCSRAILERSVWQTAKEKEGCSRAGVQLQKGEWGGGVALADLRLRES